MKTEGSQRAGKIICQVVIFHSPIGGAGAISLTLDERKQSESLRSLWICAGNKVLQPIRDSLSNHSFKVNAKDRKKY